MTQSGPHDNTPFDEILDELERHGRDDEVSVGTIRHEIGDKSFGALIVLPAVLEISPLGGIPGVPTFLATFILLIAAQVAWGRSHLWLPDVIENRSVGGDKLCKAVGFLRRPARWIDRTFHDRLTRFTTPHFDKVVAVVCIVLALTVPPLEVLPFATTLPMAAIALLGLALLFDDGLMVLIGLLLAALAVGAGVYFLL